ncbi:hypothetical protein F5Y15DRAFT_78115 [Xylariaceae sp. FL0016]|nr:hypothetical protein F5Y15DRAFT_78115 [Xylariaceae sp. FL0016]
MSDEEKRLRLKYWLAVGGTSLPPKETSFQRMASERKAAYRVQLAYSKGRKQALQKFEQKYGSPGFAGLAMNILGTKKREKPCPKELSKQVH